MELKDFVSQTLSQIVEGGSDARLEVAGKNVAIAPQLDHAAGHKGYEHVLPVADDAPATMVNFDVSLATTEGTGTKGGIGVVAGIVSLGSSGQSSNERASQSRIQFSVPIVLSRRENKSAGT